MFGGCSIAVVGKKVAGLVYLVELAGSGWILRVGQRVPKKIARYETGTMPNTMCSV